MLPLFLLLFVPLFADPDARMNCPRAKADFKLSADPQATAWKKVPSIKAAVNPTAGPAGPDSFEFRTQWTERHLYFLFICPYDELHLKPAPFAVEETNKLWEWDVTEVFIGWDNDNIHQYKELQVSPQGEWVDLDIDRKNPNPEGGWKWNSGMTVKARVDTARKIWYGEMKIPFAALDPRPPRPGNELRINIYRLAGRSPRRSTMWTPTHNRSHHTPEQFGRFILTK
jgi:hypothetical protein